MRAVLIPLLAVASCAHCSTQSNAAAGATTGATSGAGAAAQAATGAQAESTAKVVVRRGARKLHLAVRPAPDGGVPEIDLDLGEEPDEVEAVAGSAADAGAGADAGSGADAGATADAGGSGAAQTGPPGLPWLRILIGIGAGLLIAAVVFWKQKWPPWR